MERTAWLREEASRGCGFWRRHYGVAVELDDACADALLSMLERQLAEGTVTLGARNKVADVR
jgi:hypothetical protein